MLRLKPQRVFVSLALAASLAGLAGCGGALSKAQDALAVGDDTEAEAQLRKALKSQSTADEAARLLSILLERKGEEIASEDPKGAEDYYRESLKLDSGNEAARLSLARLLMKRGFMEEANELLAMEGCHGCGRLISMMVHQNADNALAAGNVLGARTLYEQAFVEGKDPLDALGLVRTYLAPAQRDLDKAVEYLAAAAPLIAGGQQEAERQFQELRIAVLGAAAAARNNAMVEQVFEIKTYVLEEEPEFDLRFRISQAQFRNGDSDPAIQRMTNILENSGQYLEPTQREVMNAALVVMYAARVAQHLQVGDPVGAAKDIAAGLKIDPGNSRLKLQQVLAISANRLPLAFDQIAEVKQGKDRSEVEGILWAQQCFEHLDAAKMTKAYDALAKAQTLAPAAPEVLVARAWVLAESRNEDVKLKAELKDARKLSGFSYPKGRINQYPGALAYLDYAKKRIREQGVLHPFRGPGLDARMKALKDKVGAFYPHEVEWYNGTGLVELISEDGQKSVEYKGARWLKGTAIAAPGNSAEIPVKSPGVVYLDFDGKQLVVIVEANTHVKVQI